MIPMAITLKKGASIAADRYAIVGMAATCTPASDPYNIWLVELDRNGNQTMARVYDFQVNYMPGSAAGGYAEAPSYRNNHSVPMDIKPVYEDNVTLKKGYIIAGFVTEDISAPVPFDAVPTISMAQARRQACFLRIDDLGNIIWGRTIEAGAVPDYNHNWTMANKIIELPGEGFVFTGQSIQRFFAGSSTYLYGLPGGILTGGFGYQPPAAAGTSVDAHITVIDEAVEEGCSADPLNALFIASGNDLLYDAVTKKVHLLGSGLQINGQCCSLKTGKPYLIAGIIDPAAQYKLDLSATRLLDFTAIPVSAASTNRPAIVGSRVFFEPNNPQNLVLTGYLHNATFPDNGGITGSQPFFLKYHYPSRTVVGNTAQVFPHTSTNYYLSYPVARTFSPLNNFMNTAGIIDDITLDNMQLHAYAPYFFAPLSGFHLLNNTVAINTPYNNCFVFSTGVAVIEGSCPPFYTLPTNGTPGYKLIYTASTPYLLPAPDVVRIGMPITSENCPTIPFRPAGNHGVGSLSEAAEWSSAVYPVPARDVLHLRAAPESTYRIQNATGQVILTGKLKQEEERIDTKELPAGFYIIMVTEASGRNTCIKFTKQ